MSGTPSAVFPCGCPCGCTKPTKYVHSDSIVLARLARCKGCSDQAHRKAYPTDSPGHTYESRPITVDVPIDPAEAALDAEIAKQQKQAIWEDAWARWQASLPEKFRNAETQNPKVIERLRRWQKGHSGTAGLAVIGNIGEGKTFLALGYANAAIKMGIIQPSEVLYGTEAELLSAAANSSFGEVEPALRRLISRRYRLTIIDDVGRGTWLREDMRPKVFSLVFDAAWRDNKVLVITTNLIPSELKEYVGEGAMDRLRSMVGYDSIDLSERGMREKVTKEMLRKAAES